MVLYVTETDQTYSGQEGGGHGEGGGGRLLGNKGKKMSLPYRLSVRCPGLQKTSTVLLKCCFTSTETVGLLGTGAQDGYPSTFTQLLSSDSSLLPSLR